MKSIEPQQIEIEKRITEAFLVFDTQANKQADVREIGTIVRSLGLVPTEAEVIRNPS